MTQLSNSDIPQGERMHNLRRKFLGFSDAAKKTPAYYGCGVCGAWHPEDWMGDCSDSRTSFGFEELNAKHGAEGWMEI